MKSMTEPTSTISITVILKHGVIAVFGGIAHAINAHRQGESKGVLDFMLLAVLSSFFGILFGFIALHFLGSNEYATLSVSGIGGWLGIESTGLLIELLRHMLNLSHEDATLDESHAVKEKRKRK